MPSGMAAFMVEKFKELDMAGLVPKESPYSKTGYSNVIEVKGKFQARVQVKGDGTRKRRQYSLPGLFDTAEEAARYLALVTKERAEKNEIGIPLTQNKQHKPRSKPPLQPPQPPPQLPMLQLPMARAMATPIAFPMPYAPMVAASPLAMQPLCQAPPMWPLRM